MFKKWGKYQRSIRVQATCLAASAAFTIGAALATPAMAQDKTITAVMHSGLRLLDPIITTAHITRDHAYMIYDVLVAMDENFKPQPQMAGWTISDDGLAYSFQLRDGLKFHDGSPVRAADAIASLQRWGKKDNGGQLIFDITESLEAKDDTTFVWKLKQPFPPMLDVLGKQSSIPAFIMPERVASGSPDEAITDYTGSGPFVFVKEEFQPGISVTYRKFADYVPRDEPPSWMAGGKKVNVDTVKWVAVPDIQTAINALISEEIDYIEALQIDLLPILEAADNVTVEVREPLGYQTMGRMNFKYPPFDNKKIRQAAQLALSQDDVLATLIGNPDYYKVCGAVLGCGTPLGDESGAESLTSGGDVEAAKKLLKEAGYDGTPVVVLQPTDVVTLGTQPVVATQALRNAGFNVDMQAMDWQTLVTRRASRAKPSEGGWNMFFTNWIVPEISSPLVNPMLNGRGDSGFFGWPVDDELESLRAEFIAAETPEKQKEVAIRIQQHTLDNVVYVPLGQYLAPQARSNKVKGVLPSPIPVFWNVDIEN